MFVRAGSRLLQSLIAEDSDKVEQMVGFLAGLPGSGKSRVIKALQVLANTWKSPDALETVAYQGELQTAKQSTSFSSGGLIQILVQNDTAWSKKKSSRD